MSNRASPIHRQSFALSDRSAERFTGRVLHADDTAGLVKLTTLLLASLGLEVTTANNGRQALEIATLAQQKNYPFDLILMDIDMPVMDGLEAARELRASGIMIPIIAVTGCTSCEVQAACSDAGFDRFIAKPFEFETLMSAVRQYLPVQGFAALV